MGYLIEIPEFFYETDSVRALKEHVISYLRQRQGFFLIIGDQGAGKSTFLKRLKRILSGKYLPVYLDGNLKNPRDAFFRVLELADLKSGTNREIGEIIPWLVRFLFAKRKEVVILLDDAERLKDEIISFFLKLSSLESPVLKMFHLILAGEKSLIQKLAQKKEFRGFRPAYIHFLSPLRYEEYGFYLNQMLNVMQRADLKIRHTDLPYLYSLTSGNFASTREALRIALSILEKRRGSILDRKVFHALTKKGMKSGCSPLRLILFVLTLITIVLCPSDFFKEAYSRVIDSIKFLKEYVP